MDTSKTSFMSIYADIILDHYENPRNQKKLSNPTKSIKVDNPLCGDKIHMEVKVEKGKITEISFNSQGCAISTAGASILSEYVLGKTVEKLIDMSTDDVLGLLNIQLSPNRIKCALLGWEGLVKLINN